MRKVAQKACLLVLLFLTNRSALAIQAQPAETDKSLRAFLQSLLRDVTYSAREKPARYFAAFTDLKDDGAKEAIVYLTDDGWCGTGGCTALVLVPKGDSYKVVAKIPAIWLPIRVLAHKSHGWHDLGVWIQGGGVQPGYEAELSFNGKTYLNNSAVPPGRAAVHKLPGAVVVPKGAEGVPVY